LSTLKFDFFEQEVKTSELLNTGRIIPLYRSSMNLKKYGLDSRALRRLIHSALQEYLTLIEEPIDTNILQKTNLPDLKTGHKRCALPRIPGTGRIVQIKRLLLMKLCF
jgi:RecG-like helicase